MDHPSDSCASAETAQPTRRRLLQMAAGGFALAASGLFLPAGLEESAAREGALGGAKGGRHGKQHRRRHRRTHGNRKARRTRDNSPGAGAPEGSLIRYVALRVNAGDLAPSTITVDFYFRVKTGLDTFGPLVFANSSAAMTNGNVDYAPERYSIAAYIRGDALPSPVYIEFTNVLFHDGIALAPYGKIINGGSIDGSGNYVGGTTYFSGEYLSDRPREFDLGKGCCGRDMKLRVERLDDSDTQKWLNPTIKWR